VSLFASRRPDSSNGGDQVSGLFDLTGKTAVVTGGSRGIGLMIARAREPATGSRAGLTGRPCDLTP